MPRNQIKKCILYDIIYMKFMIRQKNYDGSNQCTGKVLVYGVVDGERDRLERGNKKLFKWK